MKLNNCPVCERHVRPNDARCPFCDAYLELVPASRAGPMVTAVLGLALFGCGDDTTTETTMGGSNSETMTTAPNDTETSTNPTASSTASTTGADPTTTFGGQDYAGPGGYYTSTGESETEPGQTTGTGTDTDTDTDTGTSSGGNTDSGGQDYAGAGVSPKR